MEWAGGACLVLETSANLRTNSNQEQLTLINDRPLCDWHGAWIDALLARHECDEPDARPHAAGEEEGDESRDPEAG
jgi:hypothetical protein